MSLDPLSAVINIGGKVLDKFVADKDLREKLKADMMIAAMNGELKEMEASASVIMKEAEGNWIQRSWRPLTMIWFSFLLGLYWFGYAPAYLIEAPTTINQLFNLLQIGIGGYIVGRSGEKIADSMRK